SPKASGMTSLPRSCSRPARWAASTSAPARSARAPATAATWLAWTWSRPREAPPVRGELEEAAHGGLDGQAPGAHAPDEVDGLAQRLRADRARAGRGVGEAQDVGGEAGVGLQRGDELVGVGLGVRGEVADAGQGTVQHRELADPRDRILQAG